MFSVLLCPASVCVVFPLISEMSLAQRVLLTWVFTLVFLIMLVLKLDGKVKFLSTTFTLSVKKIFVYHKLQWFELNL